MPITVVCSTCGSKLKAPDHAAGRKTKCPKCGMSLLVPAAATISANPAPVAQVIAPPPVLSSPPVAVQAEVEVVAHRSAAATKDCPFCGEQVLAVAKKCKHCGETLDVALRAAEETRRAVEQQAPAPMVFMNSSSAAVVGGRGDARGEKGKVVAVLLALFLGGLGAHKFYLEQPIQGLLYLLFCWTMIPALLALLESISYLLMSRKKFARLYG